MNNKILKYIFKLLTSVALIICISVCSSDFAKFMKNDVIVKADSESKEITIENATFKYEDRSDGTVAIYGYSGPDEVTIPSEIEGKSVSAIGVYAFEGEDIKEVIIPDTVEEIHSYSFIECKKLEKVVLSKHLKWIGAAAFMYCEKLNNLNIPDELTEIMDYAFYMCNSLQNITMSKNITYIGEKAFAKCSSSVRFRGVCNGVAKDYAKENDIDIEDNTDTVDKNPGDVNGDGQIDTSDAVMLKKYLAGYNVEGIKEENCDVNADGEISSIDAVLLIKYNAGYKITLGE